MIFFYSFFIIGMEARKMNNLHIIELLNQIGDRVLDAKIKTYHIQISKDEL